MSYVARRLRNGGFKLQKVSRLGGKIKTDGVPKLVWPTLGFRLDMTYEEGKERASRLNHENGLVKKKNDSILVIGRRLEMETVEDSIFTPEVICLEFLAFLKKNHLRKSRKKLSHWKKAQEILRQLKILPKEFRSNKNAILDYFEQRHLSLEYTKKIIYMLNLWGEFYSERHGQFYKKIGKISRTDAERINDSYFDSNRYIGPSMPISPNDLIKLKEVLKPKQYKWMCFSVWFGLRPEEINKIKTARIELLGETQVLVVYQSKLVSLPREDRYKRIPAFLPGQQETLKFIGDELKAPLVKTLRKHLGIKCGQYGGRKDFEDLMETNGQQLLDYSAWMGHTDINMTWQKYRNKKRVHFTKI